MNFISHLRGGAVGLLAASTLPLAGCGNSDPLRGLPGADPSAIQPGNGVGLAGAEATPVKSPMHPPLGAGGG